MQILKTKKKRIKDEYLKDITGQKFGRLTARKITPYRDKKGSVIWECDCDCGAKALVSSDCLLYGNYVSCGCKKQEIIENFSRQKHFHFVEGTCVEWIANRTHRSDNTSGFRGVSQNRAGKWIVNLTFKGKRHYLGQFEDFDQAVEARLKAENEYFKPFLDDWQTKNKASDNKV